MSDTQPSPPPDVVHVAIAVFDGVDELDFVAPFEILRAAGAPLEVTLCAEGAPRTVTCGHGLRVSVTEGFPPECDWLIVPGGRWAKPGGPGARTEIERGVLAKEITRLRAAGASLASICTGAMILSAAGALRGRRATTHAVAKTALAAEGATVVDERVVDDGDVVTAGGVTSGIDLSLHLVRRLCGDAAAEAGRIRIEHAG